MTLRSGVDQPCEPTDDAACRGDKTSDYKSVDSSGGFWSGLSLFMKLVWLAMIVCGIAAFVTPYLFPQWAENYKTELSSMQIAADTGGFFKNAASINWKDALSKENKETLLLVGTGRHKDFKTNEKLENYWYMGKGLFVMKDYVSEPDYLRYSENIHDVTDEDMIYPATDVEQHEAAAYCQSQGGRLPSLRELQRAEYFDNVTTGQGKTGAFLRSNLILNVSPEYSLWTSTLEGDGFFSGDNYAVYTRELDIVLYEDDDYNDEKLSFVCVIPETKK